MTVSELIRLLSEYDGRMGVVVKVRQDDNLVENAGVELVSVDGNDRISYLDCNSNYVLIS